MIRRISAYILFGIGLPSIAFFKKHITSITFLILLLSATPYSTDYTASVVPGWHTTIYPPYFIAGLIVAFVLLLVTTGYWVMTKRTGKIKRTIFVIHIILTIPIIVFLKFPFLLLPARSAQHFDELTELLSFQAMLIEVSAVCFVVGQVLFLIYFVRQMLLPGYK